MAGKTMLAAILLALLILPQAVAAALPKQVVDARLVELADRDVLVLRGNDTMPTVNTYKRDADSNTLYFLLSRVGCDSIAAPTGSTPLISGVAFDAQADVSGTTVVVQLASADLLNPEYFRFSQPSRGVIMLEIFPGAGMKQTASRLTDVESIAPAIVPEAPPVPPVDTVEPLAPPFDADALGIPSVDLSSADPARVLGLAAATGLLDLQGTALVATENWGELTIKPAGQSMVSWIGETPPGEPVSLRLTGATRSVPGAHGPGHLQPAADAGAVLDRQPAENEELAQTGQQRRRSGDGQPRQG